MVEFLADFGGFPLTPFFGKKWDLDLGGVTFFVTNFDHLLVLAYPEKLSQIRVGGFYPPPLFAKKLDFDIDGVKNFVANFDHSLVSAYPENLSQIRVG